MLFWRQRWLYLSHCMCLFHCQRVQLPWMPVVSCLFNMSTVGMFCLPITMAQWPPSHCVLNILLLFSCSTGPVLTGICWAAFQAHSCSQVDLPFAHGIVGWLVGSRFSAYRRLIACLSQSHLSLRLCDGIAFKFLQPPFPTLFFFFSCPWLLCRSMLKSTLWLAARFSIQGVSHGKRDHVANFLIGL